jgi:hypothetical protein
LFQISLLVPSQYSPKESGACSFWQRPTSTRLKLMGNFHYSEKEKTYVTKEEIRAERDKHLVSEKQKLMMTFAYCSTNKSYIYFMFVLCTPDH